MKTIIKNDQDKINKEIAKTKVYIKGLVKEQESILKVAEAGLKKSEAKLNMIRLGMSTYEQGVKEPDENFYKLKRTYEKYLKDKDTFQKTIQVASETIEEANLAYFQGSQDEINE